MEGITVMYWGNGMSGWGVLLMSVSGVLFWGLIIAAVVVLVRAAGRGGGPVRTARQTPAPPEVLADRFARGEIDEEEYTRRLRVLRTAIGGDAPHKP